MTYVLYSLFQNPYAETYKPPQIAGHSKLMFYHLSDVIQIQMNNQCHNYSQRMFA